MIHLQTEYDQALVFISGSGDDRKIEFSYDSCGQFDAIDFRGAKCAIGQYGEIFYPDGAPSIKNLEVIADAMVGKVKLWNGESYLTEDMGSHTKFYGFPKIPPKQIP